MNNAEIKDALKKLDDKYAAIQTGLAEAQEAGTLTQQVRETEERKLDQISRERWELCEKIQPGG